MATEDILVTGKRTTPPPLPLQTFTRKIIQLQFTLGTGSFDGGQDNTMTISGTKVQFRKQEQGGVTSTYASIVVWGLTPSHSNQLSTYGNVPQTVSQNTVIVSAGDEENGLSQVFNGTIYFANSDLNALPNTCLVITALCNYQAQVASVPATSYSGQTSAVTIMRALAAQWLPTPLTLENNGVSVQISNPYYSGSIVQQMIACAKAGNFNWYPDVLRGVLAIWPQTGSRSGTPIVIGPDSGLVGYPTFGIGLMSFKTYFNPSLIYAKQIQLQSSLPQAIKIVNPVQIRTALDSETPNGEWFQYVDNAYVVQQ
jgi:hypothetical protein